MKTLLLGTIITIIGLSATFSQKYGYVDTEYILENIPEYKDAQNQLDDQAAIYQEEIEKELTEINRLYENFRAESVLMPDDVKARKKEDLQKRELAVKELQTKYFGVGGELFEKREELVKPIQEKIFNAIEEIATDKNYAFVFDKAGSLTILYSNSKFDISDDVLDAVGAELGTVRREDRVKNEYKAPPSSSGSSSKPEQNTNRNMSQPPGKGSLTPGGGNNKERK
ncbi:MAG: OmpH family outer membrane protein [Bacteroidales bacterium]